MDQKSETVRDGWKPTKQAGVMVRREEGEPVRAAINEDVVFADDAELELRDELELLCGCWLDIGEWSATNESADETEVTARITRCERQPTHRVTFTPDRGEPQVWLVMLEEGGAYSHAEWETETGSWWTFDEDEGWRCGGQTTPNGGSGEIIVTRLEKA